MDPLTSLAVWLVGPAAGFTTLRGVGLIEQLARVGGRVERGVWLLSAKGASAKLCSIKRLAACQLAKLLTKTLLSQWLGIMQC